MNEITRVTEEFIIGGSAASFACLFTNPLEVVKTRLQLQGELKGKSDGILSLQSGLVSGVIYQLVMNGTRLGSYQIMADFKLHMNKDGTVSYYKAVLMGASTGAFGAYVGSPLYLVKTHMQAYSVSHIAVGYQRQRLGMFRALRTIYSDYGIQGLWRGWQAQVVRVMAGSSAQLSTFSKFKSLLHVHEISPMNTLWNSFLASCASAIAVTIVMAPFDVLSTRIYNQPLDAKGKGLYYTGIVDAFIKVVNNEGPFGLYKGASAVFVRLSPHTIITLLVWDRMRNLYNKISKRNKSNFSTG